MLATLPAVSTALCRTIVLAGSRLGGQAGSPSSVMSQLPSWQMDCAPWQVRCSLLAWCGGQAWHGKPYHFCLFVVLITGLPLTVPTSMAVSFAPVFSTTPGGIDPVAAALSRVGLPSSECAQTAIVPLVNPAVPPVADLCGGAAAIPGWGSVPPRLTKKILALEFVDMWELLPESWRLEPAEAGCCHSRRPRRGLVTNFPLWVECYAALVATLSTRYPAKMPHFMAYLRTITRASRNFEGTAWASYDMAFRRQAANLRSLDWGVIDSALYNEAFTGRARLIPRCRFCLADTHDTKECTFAPEERQSPVRAFSSPREQRSVQICQLFNKPSGNACRYRHCRYAHLCSKCRRGSHPAAECTGRHGRSPSPKEGRLGAAV